MYLWIDQWVVCIYSEVHVREYTTTSVDSIDYAEC
jgi:hypothetical protein